MQKLVPLIILIILWPNTKDGNSATTEDESCLRLTILKAYQESMYMKELIKCPRNSHNHIILPTDKSAADNSRGVKRVRREQKLKECELFMFFSPLWSAWLKLIIRSSLAFFLRSSRGCFHLMLINRAWGKTDRSHLRMFFTSYKHMWELLFLCLYM